MKTILDVHFQTGKILDVNYSLGVFYKKVNREVVGVDIRPMTHIQADNRALPFASDTFDVGVCDPPYRRGSSDTKYRERYGHAPYTKGSSIIFSTIERPLLCGHCRASRTHVVERSMI